MLTDVITFAPVGLHMIMNIKQNEYMAMGNDVAGIRLIVHHRDRLPYPEDEGVTLTTGFTTSIGMRQVGEYSTESVLYDCKKILLNCRGQNERMKTLEAIVY